MKFYDSIAMKMQDHPNQKIKNTESGIIFSNTTLKKVQTATAHKKQNKTTQSMIAAWLNLDTQDLEIDKMMLWYEKIKAS
mgnify:CR=1 FL=1